MGCKLEKQPVLIRRKKPILSPTLTTSLHKKLELSIRSGDWELDVEEATPVAEPGHGWMTLKQLDDTLNKNMKNLALEERKRIQGLALSSTGVTDLARGRELAKLDVERILKLQEKQATRAKQPEEWFDEVDSDQEDQDYLEEEEEDQQIQQEQSEEEQSVEEEEQSVEEEEEEAREEEEDDLKFRSFKKKRNQTVISDEEDSELPLKTSLAPSPDQPPLSLITTEKEDFRESVQSEQEESDDDNILLRRRRAESLQTPLDEQLDTGSDAQFEQGRKRLQKMVEVEAAVSEDEFAEMDSSDEDEDEEDIRIALEDDLGIVHYNEEMLDQENVRELHRKQMEAQDKRQTNAIVRRLYGNGNGSGGGLENEKMLNEMGFGMDRFEENPRLLRTLVQKNELMDDTLKKLYKNPKTMAFAKLAAAGEDLEVDMLDLLEEPPTTAANAREGFPIRPISAKIASTVTNPTATAETTTRDTMQFVVVKSKPSSVKPRQPSTFLLGDVKKNGLSLIKSTSMGGNNQNKKKKK